MALAILNRGTDGGTASSTTITPTSNFGSSSLAVLIVLVSDNVTLTNNPTDSNGNEWVRYYRASDFDVTYPSAEAVFVSKQLSTLTTSDTVSFSIGSSENYSAFLYELTTSSSKRPAFIKAFSANSASSDVTIVPSSEGIITGDGIIAWVSDNTSVAYTGDGDTTDGSWSAIQTEDNPNFSSVIQSKIITGTSTQTFSPSVGTWNYVGYCAFREHSLPDENLSGFFGL